MKRAFALLIPIAIFAGCGNRNENHGTGLVAVEAGPVANIDAAPATTDINSCTGCTIAFAPAWAFQGIYKDDKCTAPVAQLDVSVCIPVPPLGLSTNLAFNEPVGAHKANDAAEVNLTDQVAPDAAHYQKTDRGCVKANEVATAITPLNCAGQRVCRDANGVLGCANCRTLTGGCPDLMETRLYASIDDPNKAAPAPQGNGNLEKLRQCCVALGNQARSMGASPEAGMMATTAVQCQAIVAQAGPTGTAPELGPIRSFLQNANVPAVCKGL